MKMRKQKYKGLRFKTEYAFKKWLHEKATRIIRFKDFGQDLLEIWTDVTGEILHSDAQPTIWNGCFVNMETLQIKKPIELDTAGKWHPMMKLVVEAINRPPHLRPEKKVKVRSFTSIMKQIAKVKTIKQLDSAQVAAVNYNGPYKYSKRLYIAYNKKNDRVRNPNPAHLFTRRLNRVV